MDNRGKMNLGNILSHQKSQAGSNHQNLRAISNDYQNSLFDNQHLENPDNWYE